MEAGKSTNQSECVQSSRVLCTRESSEHSTEPQQSTNPNKWLQITNILLGCKKSRKQETSEKCADCQAIETSKCICFNEGWRKCNNYHDRLPPASELSKAGIQFKACEGNTLVMNYDKTNCWLKLPCLVVYDGMEDVLRNLIAHEQISKDEVDFTMYAIIMDSLIDTEQDLAILTGAKVLENHLGSDERLVQMWNDMCINISEESYEKIWSSIIKDVMEHYRIQWRFLYVEFRAKFCSRPWLWMSAFAAILLLLLSLLQTIYTVLGFY